MYVNYIISHSILLGVPLYKKDIPRSNTIVYDISKGKGRYTAFFFYEDRIHLFYSLLIFFLTKILCLKFF